MFMQSEIYRDGLILGIPSVVKLCTFLGGALIPLYCSVWALSGPWLPSP